MNLRYTRITRTLEKAGQQHNSNLLKIKVNKNHYISLSFLLPTAQRFLQTQMFLVCNTSVLQGKASLSNRFPAISLRRATRGGSLVGRARAGPDIFHWDYPETWGSGNSGKQIYSQVSEGWDLEPCLDGLRPVSDLRPVRCMTSET